MQHTRRQLITLLRGQVSCPVLANLAELGWLDKMSAGSFSITDFSDSRPEVAAAVFRYLAAIGLLLNDPQNSGCYTTSDLGRSVFLRFGSFCILNSYQALFQDLSSLLFPGHSAERPAVNRFRNVLGSGQLHATKFFSRALRLFIGRSFPFVVDLGCGNGQFLQQVADTQLAKKLGGIDTSEVAVAATRAAISAANRGDTQLHTVKADASQIDAWSDHLPWFAEGGLFSLWFVIHEFSRSDPGVVIQFFQKINWRYPLAELVVGEIVRLPAAILADNRMDSIMPEFLFFHEISEQGVLSWSEWEEIRKAIPFRVVSEQHLDSIQVEGSESVPSNFIWHLKPI